MRQIDTHTSPALPDTDPVTAFRARSNGIALILAALLIAAGEVTTPGSSTGDAKEQVAAFVDHPGLTQVSATLFHFGYLLVLPGIVGMLALTRRRSVQLAHVGALLALLGFASLAGNMLVDLVTLSAGQQLGVAEGARFVDEIGSLPAASAFVVPAFLGSFLGLILLMVALGRAGEIAWAWVAVTVVGIVLLVAAPVHVVTVVGFLALAVGLAAVGARILRG